MGWDEISQGYTDILIGNMEFYDKSLRGLGEYCILFSAQISQAFINQSSRQIPLLYSNDFTVLLHEFNSAKTDKIAQNFIDGRLEFLQCIRKRV